MLNFQAVIFMWMQTYMDIFRFALVYLLEDGQIPPQVFKKKKPFCKNFEYLQELLKIILELYYKETPTQMLSCEYWKISKNTYLKNICVQLLLKWL